MISYLELIRLAGWTGTCAWTCQADRIGRRMSAMYASLDLTFTSKPAHHWACLSPLLGRNKRSQAFTSLLQLSLFVTECWRYACLKQSPILIGTQHSERVLPGTVHVFYKQPMFYYLGHIAAFVPPGSTRVHVEVHVRLSLLLPSPVTIFTWRINTQHYPLTYFSRPKNALFSVRVFRSNAERLL